MATVPTRLCAAPQLRPAPPWFLSHVIAYRTPVLISGERSDSTTALNAGQEIACSFLIVSSLFISRPNRFKAYITTQEPSSNGAEDNAVALLGRCNPTYNDGTATGDEEELCKRDQTNQSNGTSFYSYVPDVFKYRLLVFPCLCIRKGECIGVTNTIKSHKTPDPVLQDLHTTCCQSPHPRRLHIPSCLLELEQARGRRAL